STTTCDRSPPHYRIQARKMTIVPGDRMILEGARFRVGEKTWFRLPRYVINLQTGEGVDRFFFRPGYTSARGFTLRSAYQFWVSDSLFGRLSYNPSQFEGTNLGTTVNYRLDERNLGQFDFTHDESRLIRQSASRYQLAHQARMPWANANFNALMTDTTFGTLGTDSELNVSANLSRAFPGWATQLALDRRFDLDGSRYPYDNVQVLESTPRFTFAQTGSTKLWGTGIGLGVDGSLAHYRERMEDTGRAEVNFNVSLPPMRLGKFQEINASMRQTEDIYGTGDVRHFFSFQANTFEHYGRSFNSGFNYVYQDEMGDPSPFASFDTLPPRNHLLTGYLRMGDYDAFTATLFQVTRDFVTGQFIGASSNFVYHTPIGGRRFVSLSLTPFYDVSRDPSSLTSLRLGSLSANARVASGDRWEHALITNYDAQGGRLQSVATRSGFLLDPKTRIDLDSNTSRNVLGTGYELTKLNLGITKDFHDFEGRMRWNPVQEEIFFEFYLKSASDKRVGAGMHYGDVPDLLPTFGAGGPVGLNY
ncbi:MAG: hypothetical protein HY814_06895, partial [Candidatus Riflebacteria bacterium]|nr:hypothetical protein [Candidatus Riflebacteria bacterium]